MILPEILPLRDKPYNVKMQVQFEMSINEHVMMSSEQRLSFCP